MAPVIRRLSVGETARPWASAHRLVTSVIDAPVSIITEPLVGVPLPNGATVTPMNGCQNESGLESGAHLAASIFLCAWRTYLMTTAWLARSCPAEG